MLFYELIRKDDKFLQNFVTLIVTQLIKMVEKGIVHGNINRHTITIWDDLVSLESYEYSYEFGTIPAMSSDMEAYQPPEIEQKSTQLQQKWSHDVYSLGIVLTEIVTGIPADNVDKYCKIQTTDKKIRLGTRLLNKGKNDLSNLKMKLGKLALYDFGKD